MKARIWLMAVIIVMVAVGILAWSQVGQVLSLSQEARMGLLNELTPEATSTIPPPGPSGTPTATSVANAYAPIVLDTASTPTIWLTATFPPPGGTDTPTPPPGSTATFTPTATSTVPPGSSPTPHLTPTEPPF